MNKSDSERLHDDIIRRESSESRNELSHAEKVDDMLSDAWMLLDSLNNLLKLEGEAWFSRSSIISLIEEIEDLRDAKPAMKSYLTRSHSDVEDY